MFGWIGAIQKIGSALKKGTSAASKPVDDVNARFKNVMDLLNSKTGLNQPAPPPPQPPTNAGIPPQTSAPVTVDSVLGSNPQLAQLLAKYGVGMYGGR